MLEDLFVRHSVHYYIVNFATETSVLVTEISLILNDVTATSCHQNDCNSVQQYWLVHCWLAQPASFRHTCRLQSLVMCNGTAYNVVGECCCKVSTDLRQLSTDIEVLLCSGSWHSLCLAPLDSLLLQYCMLLFCISAICHLHISLFLITQVLMSMSGILN